MNKKDLKKLALMGITGGVMLASPEANAAGASSNADGALAALSWTQNKQGCGGKDGCGGKTDKTRPGGQSTQKPRPTPGGNRIIAENDEEGGSHACNGCGASGGYKGGKTGNSVNTSNAGNQNGCGGKTQPNYGAQSGCGAKTTGVRNKSGNRIVADAADESGHACGGKMGCGGAKKKTSTPNVQNRLIGESEDQHHEGQEHTGSGQGCGGKNGCGGAKPEQPISESQFVGQLNPEGKRIFNTLTPEGKQLAIRLSKQYTDKNQAVKHAARQITREEARESGSLDNSAKRQNLSR